jgi:hypothetical protein
MLQGIAMSRERIKNPSDLVPESVVIDECHNFLTPSVEQIHDEARKYKVFLTLCQQNVGYRMTPEMRNIVTGMTNVKIAGMVEADRQERTAKLFPISPERFGELEIGYFFVRMGRSPSFKLNARSDLVGYRNSMTVPSWKRLVKRQVRSYYRSVDEPAHTTVDQKPGGKGKPGSSLKREGRKFI